MNIHGESPPTLTTRTSFKKLCFKIANFNFQKKRKLKERFLVMLDKK